MDSYGHIFAAFSSGFIKQNKSTIIYRARIRDLAPYERNGKKVAHI